MTAIPAKAEFGAYDRREVLAVDFERTVAKLAGAFPKLARADVEDCVQDAWLEIASLAEREPLQHPFARLVGQRARWRVLDRMKETQSVVSLDGLAEATDDSAPVEIAVHEDDLDTHLAIEEARQDPIMEEKLRAVEAGAAARITPRGSFHRFGKFSAEQVAEARRLWAADLPRQAIADAIGCSPTTVANWIQNRGHAFDSPGWSDDRILDALRRSAKRLGRPPKFEEVGADPTLPTTRTICERFGSFNKALTAAGLPTRRSIDGGRKRHTRETLDAAFLAFEREHGRWPKYIELRAANGFAGCITIERVYGTLSIRKIRAQIEAMPPSP